MGKAVEFKPPSPAEEPAPAEAEPAEETKASQGRRKPRGHVYINEERCKGCGFCVAFCPQHVLALSERFNQKGYHPPEARQPEECVGCGLCGYYCPDFAIFGVRVRDDKKKKDKKAS